MYIPMTTCDITCNAWLRNNNALSPLTLFLSGMLSLDSDQAGSQLVTQLCISIHHHDNSTCCHTFLYLPATLSVHSPAWVHVQLEHFLKQVAVIQKQPLTSPTFWRWWDRSIKATLTVYSRRSIIIIIMLTIVMDSCAENSTMLLTHPPAQSNLQCLTQDHYEVPPTQL